MICGLAGIIFIGGNRFIAGVCNWLVPIMSFLYLGGCILIIWKNRMVLPETFETIFNAAFTGRAAAGGAAGQGLLLGIRTGIARGLFTNEAGLGSIPMAAAASGEKSPKRQGMISMTGPFWDTVVMCALTGIAIVGSVIAAAGKIRRDGCGAVMFSGVCPDTGRNVYAVGGVDTVCVCNDHRLECVRNVCGAVSVGRAYGRKIPGHISCVRISGCGDEYEAGVGNGGCVELSDGTAKSLRNMAASEENRKTVGL